MSKALALTPESALERARAEVAITLAAIQKDAEADAMPEALATITVDDAGDYTIVTGIRAEVRAKKDELVRLRQTAATPWKKIATTIEEMFRPAIRALEAIEADYKSKLEAYQLAKVKAEQEARERATAAAMADDSPALVEALSESAALAVRDDGGSVRTRWVVKRISRDLLPAEYLMPDTAKIGLVAAQHRGDEPPVIPGVVFALDVSVAVRR